MTDHIFLLYSPCEQILNYTRVVGRQSSCDTLEFSFLRDYDDEFSLHAYGVHYSSCGPCGVRLVYEEDIEELKQVTSQYNNDQKDVQSAHSQSISQLSKLRLMGPIRCTLWTGLRGILDVDDNLELEMMRRGACEMDFNISNENL
ncbi:hypothetical protein FNV43_RR08566 [Rhamnella rubrinervis]|uniref:Uncharacterized protein n=1 Tax=Rhamnella rubrinervis TaxID=2594499 RepID=A0A8K0MJG4_9ROSA|nr:hypothetical protein FNV43_RR08566 [Rhamnella rubrinervis]